MKLATIYHNFIQLVSHFGIKREKKFPRLHKRVASEKLDKFSFFAEVFKKLKEYGKIKTKAIHHLN